jgi:2-aminophenol/2-amino-5-chlorophenol 1,6-dioxygenase alpha subunit
MWPSILGHQLQANPEPEWTHVDEDFHYLGSIPYKFRIDAEFAELAVAKAQARGLRARTCAYHGFPIDTGSVVALKLLNPDNELPAVIVSSNIYANRTETVVLGKALRDAVEEQGRKAVAVVVSTLSNRLVTEPMEPADDHIHSLKDDEWNRKFLEYLEKGRLEDLSQLSRQFHDEARVPKVVAFKPFWWWAAFMGQANLYAGTVHAYEPVWGTGSAVVSLEPAGESTGDLEYDEDDPEFYAGDREVLDLHDAPSMGALPEGDGD